MLSFQFNVFQNILKEKKLKSKLSIENMNEENKSPNKKSFI